MVTKVTNALQFTLPLQKEAGGLAGRCGLHASFCKAQKHAKTLRIMAKAM
jgi:hypothetical protein